MVGRKKRSIPPTILELGAPVPATGGFFWKPVCDNHGDLAVIPPRQYTGKVKQVRVLIAESTKVLTKGKYSGVGNSERKHYRCNKPGGSYSDGATVVTELDNGAVRHLKINDTTERTER